MILTRRLLRHFPQAQHDGKSCIEGIKFRDDYRTVTFIVCKVTKKNETGIIKYKKSIKNFYTTPVFVAAL
jgi:hypothetical protein